MKTAKRQAVQSGFMGNEPLPPRERYTFANNFKKARKAAGLTQEDVRRLTGFAQPFISEVENGISSINLDNAAQLAAAVGEPLWRLLLDSSD